MANTNRRSIRLHGHDYCAPGYYFVTICTASKIRFFGYLKDNRVILNEYGWIARREWIKTAHIRTYVRFDAFIVMPDHIHGIIHITNNSLSKHIGATRRVAPTSLAPSSLGAIIGQYKSLVTKQIRKMGKSDFKWQRGYYDYVIRNNKELYAVRQYIINNPIKGCYMK